MPDMNAALNSDQRLPTQQNIKHSNEQGKKMASLSNMAAYWWPDVRQGEKGHLAHLYAPPTLLSCIADAVFILSLNPFFISC